MAWRGRRLETVIDAGAHHVHLNARAVGHGRYARNHDSIGCGTEIDIEIFELALQFGPNASSVPAPSVQPLGVEFCVKLAVAPPAVAVPLSSTRPNDSRQ